MFTLYYLFFKDPPSHSHIGTISSYSSWGLGPDLGVKPDIAAPGGEIYSTYLTKEGGYATLR